jgi:hypothetical protein
VRANENIALSAIHTLFGREHNRLVRRLPSNLSAETRRRAMPVIAKAAVRGFDAMSFRSAAGLIS